MPLQFTVLASGSAGNASLLEIDGFGLLLDAGLGPRQLAARLAAVGRTWNQVHAVLLTHTHSDHWRNPTLAHLSRKRIPLYCHVGHHRILHTYGSAFAPLQAADLVRGYEPETDLILGPGLRCRALPLCHDGGPTFGFRFEAPGALFGRPCTLGYAADLGSWDAPLAQALADVEVLALEFNHDVELEHASDRSPYLIARVLGAHGHLSNEQATALVQEILRRSSPGRLQHLVLLHLSRECNRPNLARESAVAALGEHAAAILVHAASQDHPSPTLLLGGASNGVARARVDPPVAKLGRKSPKAPGFSSWLPGMEV
jgi:glyoxylase-like metal-dependent hydrolase (beta-lactamase superfamily II)